METEVVKALFEAQGCTVETHESTESSKSDFLRAYEDEATDVLWVVSHGEYNHWDPKSVSIQISHDRKFVGLDDLIDKAPSTPCRRLLVLNVCDGGRFEQTGALPQIGFAPALACQHQAVVSHLWPVRGIPAAAFGAVFASRLASGASYFDSFDTTLAAIRSSNELIARGIEDATGHASELSKRLQQSTTENMENFASSGSPVFFQ